MTEKKNEIGIKINGRRYALSTDNTPRPEKRGAFDEYDIPQQRKDFYSLLESILNERINFYEQLKEKIDFYERYKKLEFEETSLVKISKKEKEAFEKIVRKLEKFVIDNKKLEYTISKTSGFLMPKISQA